MPFFRLRSEIYRKCWIGYDLTKSEKIGLCDGPPQTACRESRPCRLVRHCV